MLTNRGDARSRSMGRGTSQYGTLRLDDQRHHDRSQRSEDATLGDDMFHQDNGPSGIRTRTALTGQRILSPLRLPVPPQGHD